MKFSLTLFTLAFWVVDFASIGCHTKPPTPALADTNVDNESCTPPRKFISPLTFKKPDTLPTIAVEPNFLTALYHQEAYLLRKSTPRCPIPGFTKHEMLNVVRTLKGLPFFNTSVLAEAFDFYQLDTPDKNDRVRVTGYYTPRVEARRHRDAQFNYPILRKPPAGFKMPSLSQLRGQALPDSLTAIAWARSEREVENAQLQGSCLLYFPDGRRKFLGFGGSVSLPGSGKYVFFTEVDDEVIGAGSFPMTAGYSIAIDPKVAPIGSMIFAELPVLSPTGKLLGYTYRVMMAQDRGGAIKTTKRIDVYSGIGREGLEAARKINQFGRFWVMLPKKRGDG